MTPGKKNRLFFKTHPYSASENLRIFRPSLNTRLTPQIRAFVLGRVGGGGVQATSKYISVFQLKFQCFLRAQHLQILTPDKAKRLRGEGAEIQKREGP